MSKTLGQTLREQRRALGLRQHEVADRIGVVQQTYGRWENDAARPRDPAHLTGLAEFLEIPPETVILRAFVQPAPLTGSATEKLDAVLDAIHAFSAIVEDLVEHQREFARPGSRVEQGRVATGA
ncbi:MAG: helix-turn-helix domain-containing protein [Acidimicrobiia bacterium]